MAPIELHIYGPAFGLPSVDVKCLAAVALLQCCFQVDPGLWRLVPSNDPSLNPFNELPALKEDDVWVAGFRNIAKYMSSQYHALPSKSDFTFDVSDLNETQRADTEAYLSFLESRGLPLLDLSLYVSSDNYTTCTRSALSEIFPWPQSWTIPQRLRDDARRRSEHLGLSGLDVDATREKELKKENEGLSAHIPKSLRRPKPTVSALLGSTAEQTRFRLEAVTADFFEPLEELLGDKKYFLGDEMSVLDCFALAVLTQMRVDGLPQSWLKTALDNRYSLLSRWASKNAAELYEGSTPLPWASVAEKTWLQVASSVVTFLAESSPITIIPKAMHTNSSQDPAEGDSIRSERTPLGKSQKALEIYQKRQAFHSRNQNQRIVLQGLITSMVSFAGLAGVLIYKGLLSMPTMRKSQPMRRNFGEAGALLGLGLR